MQDTVKLCPSGNRVHLVLENWSSGLVRRMRRWILEDGFWRCADSEAIAGPARFRNSVCRNLRFSRRPKKWEHGANSLE
jgi:hypothetical protein